MKIINKYFPTDVWEPMPIQNAEDIAAGYENSEACQACLYVTLDPIEGKIGYYGTDCGGIYRTEDSGKTWIPCNIGYKSHGGACAIIDPFDTSRAIMVGCNTGLHIDNGLHITYNAGKSWKPVYMPGDEGFDGQLSSYKGEKGCFAYDYRIQLAYDETSYDDKIGGCAVVYWSREDCPDRAKEYNSPSLYKSIDGGETWARLPNTEEYAGGYIVVNPKDGRLAVSNEKGVWISSDGGSSFNKASDLKANSMVGVRTRPDSLFVLTNDGLFASHDFGVTFINMTEKMPSDIKKVSRLRVSPVNPNRMLMYYRGLLDEWDWRAYITEDGGKTWEQCVRDHSGMWIPEVSWTAVTWFSPVDENYIIGNEHRSEDGGKTFFISTKGFNAILVGGHYSINVNNPDLMSFASQDFNGGFSTDGGKSWTYLNWSGEEWGGFAYGAYSMTDKIHISAPSPSWWVTGELAYTLDGGGTVVRTGLPVDGQRVGYGIVGKENIAFLAEYRTDDYCKSFAKMDGCTGVFTHDKKTGRLFGANNTDVVYSDDDGITWHLLARGEHTIQGLEYNQESGVIYLCANGDLLYADSKSESPCIINAGCEIKRAFDICIDNENPDIMYVICSGAGNSMDNYRVLRTLDGGKTWTELMRKIGDGRDNCPDGGYGMFITFNEETREIITCGACRGIWKMKAPNIKK